MYERTSTLVDKKMREYLWPSLISAMSILLATIIDGIIVGQALGAPAMAAVGLAQPITLFYQVLFFLFGAGGATAIAIAKGKRDTRGVSVIFTLAGISLLLVSLLVAVGALLGIDGVVALLCTDAALFDLTKSFSEVMIAGAPVIVVVSGAVYYLRVDGQPKTSARILLVANIVNLGLDLLFIFGLGMGIGGAALATVLGYAVGGVFVVRYMFSGQRSLRFCRLKGTDLARITAILNASMASSLNTGLLLVKKIALNILVLTVAGQDGMAIFTVCNFMVSFVSIFVSGGAEAMVPILGILFGEKDVKGMRYIFRRTVLFVVISCGVSMLVMQLFPEQTLMLFGISTAEQLAPGARALQIFELSLPLMGAAIMLMYFMQTTVRRSIALVITLVRGLAVIPLAYGCAELFGATGIWSAFVAIELVALLVALVMCLISAQRSSRPVSRILLIEKPHRDVCVLDATIKPEAESIVGVSQKFGSLLQEQGVNSRQARFIALCIEEACSNMLENSSAESTHAIDIVCRRENGETRLIFRNDGEAFDALTLDSAAQQEFTSLSVLKAIAESVDYSRTIGLNNTLVVMGDREG